MPKLTPREEAQLMNYLKAANMHRGALMNFGEEVLGKKRIVWNLPPELDPLRRLDLPRTEVAEPSTFVGDPGE